MAPAQPCHPLLLPGGSWATGGQTQDGPELGGEAGLPDSGATNSPSFLLGHGTQGPGPVATFVTGSGEAPAGNRPAAQQPSGLDHGPQLTKSQEKETQLSPHCRPRALNSKPHPGKGRALASYTPLPAMGM